jgi:hypothetical protein
MMNTMRRPKKLKLTTRQTYPLPWAEEPELREELPEEPELLEDPQLLLLLLLPRLLLLEELEPL